MFEIRSGVRRAVAAHLAGRHTISARVYDGASGHLIETRDLSIAHLLSPKDILDLRWSSAVLVRFLRIQNAYVTGSPVDPIEVQVGSTGTPIGAIRVLR